MRVPLRSVVVMTMVTIVLAAGPLAGASTEPIDAPVATTAAATATDNAFFPEDTTVNVSDCVSALPRPECGSRERGGWRQGAVFGVVVVGLVAIAVRLVIGVRRRDSGHTAADDS
jgi:hypothetical protein